MQQALLRRRLKSIANNSSQKDRLLKRQRYKCQQTEGQAKEFTARKARKLLKNAIATVSEYNFHYLFFIFIVFSFHIERQTFMLALLRIPFNLEHCLSVNILECMNSTLLLTQRLWDIA